MQTMGGSILLNPGAPSHGAGGMFPGTIHPLSIVFFLLSVEGDPPAGPV